MYYFSILILALEVVGSYGSRNLFPLRDYDFNHKYDYANNLLYYQVIGSDYKLGEDIWRPCSLDDYDCMRAVLSSNSMCFPSYGETPDPLQFPLLKFYFPVAKMSATHFNPRIEGFRNAEVSEFYINQATKNLVISVTVPSYNMSAYSFLTYQRTAREPISLCDNTHFEGDEFTLTAILPKIPFLRLDMAEIYATPSKIPLRSHIGPRAYTSNDPTVNANYETFTSNIVTIVKEVFVFPAYLLMSIFIQNELCDFGVDSYKNYNGYTIGKCYPAY